MDWYMYVFLILFLIFNTFRYFQNNTLEKIGYLYSSDYTIRYKANSYGITKYQSFDRTTFSKKDNKIISSHRWDEVKNVHFDWSYWEPSGTTKYIVLEFEKEQYSIALLFPYRHRILKELAQYVSIDEFVKDNRRHDFSIIIPVFLILGIPVAISYVCYLFQI